jgi:hypothetical protein
MRVWRTCLHAAWTWLVSWMVGAARSATQNFSGGESLLHLITIERRLRREGSENSANLLLQPFSCLFRRMLGADPGLKRSVVVTHSLTWTCPAGAGGWRVRPPRPVGTQTRISSVRKERWLSSVAERFVKGSSRASSGW